jgi:uncharacterized protein (UPF0548 family)
MDERRMVATGHVPHRLSREFAQLSGRAVNFTPPGFDAARREPSWHVDHRRCTLPGEPPGPPTDHGSFAVARRILIDYEFADPRLIRAVYDRTAPLDGRDMLLVGHFLWLRFPMGVRVGGVADGPTTVLGRPVHRFAWYYRTLEGHLEQGQMNYELRKWTETGRVEVNIDAYSRRGDIANPLVDAGFAVFARPTQLWFYRRALTRLAMLVRLRTSG